MEILLYGVGVQILLLNLSEASMKAVFSQSAS